MQEAASNLELLIGGAVRRYRLERGYTLEQLGSRAGLSRSFLSRLENGTVSASIATLLQIADALRVSVGDLFNGLEARSGGLPIIVRGGERATVTRGGSAFGYTYEVLARDGRSSIEPFIVRFLPGRRPRKRLTHPGYEFNFVIQGEVEFTYGDEVYMLHNGDSLYYDGSVPHLGCAQGSEEAILLAIVID
jgi:transcriptional regulator with XRE-family HTH domain